MKAEIYGVDETDFRCAGCLAAKKLFTEAGIEFEFNKVLTRGPDDFPVYNLETIDSLVKRAKFPNRQIVYPVVFIDDTIVRIKNLQATLYEMGYDVDSPQN